MAYAVKEVFYTLQGEGANSGRPAVFLRFSGCNLWNGRQEDRGRGAGGCSSWCDTDFVGLDGRQGGRYSTVADLVAVVESTWPHANGIGRRFVVCTGGEPLLQLDQPLIDGLHAAGFEVAIETNGTQPLTGPIDWVCVSPKAGTELVLRSGSELKLAFPQLGVDPAAFEGLAFNHFFLVPIDGPGKDDNTRRTVSYCLEHPRWRLGLQQHKLLGIP